MKSLRLLLALGFASTLAVAIARADDKQKEPAKEKDSQEASCCKEKSKDGKDSCCSDGDCGSEPDKAKEAKVEPKK